MRCPFAPGLEARKANSVDADLPGWSDLHDVFKIEFVGGGALAWPTARHHDVCAGDAQQRQFRVRIAHDGRADRHALRHLGCNANPQHRLVLEHGLLARCDGSLHAHHPAIPEDADIDRALAQVVEHIELIGGTGQPRTPQAPPPRCGGLQPEHLAVFCGHAG